MDNLQKTLKKLVRLEGKSKKYRYICFFITIALSLTDTMLAFAIPFATESFKNGYIKLAIVLLVISILQQFIYSILTVYDTKYGMKYRMSYEVDSIQNAVDILNVVRDKVYITENSTRRRLSTIEIKENTENYVIKARRFFDNVMDGAMKFFMFLSMFVGTIATTMLSVKNLPLLIIIMTVCIISIILVTIRQIKRRKIYFKKIRGYSNKLDSQKMDILNITPINEKHESFLTDNFINSSKKIYEEDIKITTKERIETCYKFGVMSISSIVLLSIAMFSYESLDIGAFASLIALSSLYGRMLQTLTNEIQSIQRLIDAYSDKKSHEDIMKKIIGKYLELINKKDKNVEQIISVKVDNLDFVHENIQNKVMHKITANKLIFKESVLIHGESGSGKSTLLNILSGKYSYEENNILINNNIYKSSLYNYLMYDPDSTLGNRSILEEITLCNDVSDIDINKLMSILKGLGLYDMIKAKANNEPIMDYLSSIFKDSFSVGQLQRFTLTRLLYNLDTNVDILLLDEPVANLDDYTADKVIKFITEFCNIDRDRIVIIASHQVEIVRKYCNTNYTFNCSNENHYKIEEM